MANRLMSGSDGKMSSSVVKIAVAAVALSVCVMIVSISVIVGFRNEIIDKVVGFGSCINIVNRESAANLETLPISEQQDFYPSIENEDGISHIQRFAAKPCILKTSAGIMGVMLKGVGNEYNWSFFDRNMVEGNTLAVADTSNENRIMISKKMSDLLDVRAGQSIVGYFVQDPPRMRKFTIAGVYSTGLEECDKMFAITDIDVIRRLNGWNDGMVTGFEVLVDNFDNLDESTEIVRNVAGYKIADDGSMLRVTNVKDSNRQFFDWLTLTEMNVWVIIGIMVFVAFVNMSTALLIIIFEKAPMIGLLKAIGAKGRQIRRIFILNSLHILIRGMIVGNAIALVLILVQHYTGVVSLDSESYYVDSVPCEPALWYFAAVDIGTLVVMAFMMTLPSLAIGLMQPAKVVGFK
jgi:lipoprotein-releasing system permease protein